MESTPNSWLKVKSFGLCEHGFHADRLALAESLLGMYDNDSAQRPSVYLIVTDNDGFRLNVTPVITGLTGNVCGLEHGYDFTGTPVGQFLSTPDPEAIIQGYYRPHRETPDGSYDYGRLEVFVPIDTEGKVTCPHCVGKKKVQRHIVGGPLVQPCPTCTGEGRVSQDVAFDFPGYTNLSLKP